MMKAASNVGLPMMTSQLRRRELEERSKYIMKRYVIGDIHGCHYELIRLLDAIDEHANGEEKKLIFVGDYVDRGPNSRCVVNLVMLLEKEGHVALMGNHEDMILCGDFTYAEATMRSFGSPFMELPDYVTDWMRTLPKYYEDDTIIVAHAGANPIWPMSEQTNNMLLWLRYQEGQPAQLDKHFYHGHTPFPGKVEQAVDRTNVDSGCVFGGMLTAAIVGDDGKPEGFISIPAKGGIYDMSDAESRGWEV
jgi:serine/threonine protein phosphatase 1